MKADGWGILLPRQVSEFINFDRDTPEWSYDPADESMAAKQAEGVAALWNILDREGVALLADEVGMGKTFQALGVMSLLWKMKPDARILVMAPNRDICRHWVREYNTFLREHYRDRDHLVRNAVDGGAIHEPRLCTRLADLVSAVKAGTSQFFLTTIHSLSRLVSGDEKKSRDLPGQARREARMYHRAIRSALENEGFDLIVIDEAHYFRNKQGNSQRVAAAEAFFGSADSRLGQKVLLMTATPSHSKPSDVKSILSYFTELEDKPDDASELLATYAIRRLRLLQGRTKAHNKYSYRFEKAVASSFKGNLDAELFFALYQKKLVEIGRASDSSRRFLYGYLEGFESVGNSTPEAMEQGEDQGGENASGDFSHNAPDSELLSHLTRQFHRIYHRFPDHPKYGSLVEQCVPKALFTAEGKLHDYKHLVFVRRIPSVREITQRINAEYDELMAREIIKAWHPDNPDHVLSEWRQSGWSRSYFNCFVESRQETQTDAEWARLTDTAEADPEENESKLSSRIMDLFSVKGGEQKRTDCTNVSLRFRRSESLFSLFLEPASDYIQGEYRTYARRLIGGRERDVYGGAAFDTRLRQHDIFVRANESGYPQGVQELTYTEPLPTAWGLMFEYLPESARKKLQSWKERNPAILENLGNYLKAGYLFASPVMVELYCWFTEFSRNDVTTDVQKRYASFVTWVTPRLPGSLMLRYFAAAVETFEAMCEKITDHRLTDREKPWRELTSLQNPAWYASGETTNRQRLILGFNSPFFPNVLVATSVFQEGVNLHLQCHKVHHYGIAWTPGDNEQRVGRVDRLFGKVNSLLKEKDEAELNIYYPYLEKSFDQEQLASFIRRKYSVEANIDAGRFHRFDSEIDIKSAAAGWEDFLRRPEASAAINEPYPASFPEVTKSCRQYTPFPAPERPDLRAFLGGRLQLLADNNSAVLHAVSDNEHHPNALYLLEAEADSSMAARQQPVVLECHFSSPFSSMISGTVYCLSFKSPLASKAALSDNRLGNRQQIARYCCELVKDAPLVKVAMDEGRPNSHFYLHTRVDLPLFILGDAINTLSDYELELAYQQIRQVTDVAEQALFDGLQDLTRSDLAVGSYANPVRLKPESLESMTASALPDHWKTSEGIGESIAILSRNLKIKDVFSIAEAHSLPSGPEAELLCLKLNHVLPMLQFVPFPKGATVRLVYPAGDFQESEQKLLERWFCRFDTISNLTRG